MTAQGVVGGDPTKLSLTGGTMTGGLIPALAPLADGATIAVNAALGNIFSVTLGGSRTLGNPTNLSDGQPLIIAVKQDATGSRTLAYGTAYEFSTSLPVPTLSTTPGATDYLGFIYSAGAGKLRLLAFLGPFS